MLLGEIASLTDWPVFSRQRFSWSYPSERASWHEASRYCQTSKVRTSRSDELSDRIQIDQARQRPPPSDTHFARNNPHLRERRYFEIRCSPPSGRCCAPKYSFRCAVNRRQRHIQHSSSARKSPRSLGDLDLSAFDSTRWQPSLHFYLLGVNRTTLLCHMLVRSSSHIL